MALKMPWGIDVLNFRRFFRGAAAVLLLCLWMGSSAALSAEPDHIVLTWTKDPMTTQTITWRTAAEVTFGEIRLYESFSDTTNPLPVTTLAARTSSLETLTGVMNLHSVTLNGLTPGRRYRYQVGAADAWSPEYSFQMASLKDGGFKFLIFGDSQSIDYGVWRATLQQAYRANPDAAFFTNVGDLVDVGQDYAEWEAWFAGVEGVVESLPTMPLTGNHESYTPERVFSRPEFFTAQFALPDNGPVGLKGQVYSFDYGDVHFVMLDSQEGEQRRFVPDLLEAQRVWLAADLAATQKKWRIAFIHRPLYGNKPEGVNERLRQSFAPLFDQYHVDVVFTAHDHVVARTAQLFDGEEMAAPARGTIYAATGRSGTKTYTNVTAKEWNVFFHNPVEDPNYLVVMVNADQLRVKAVTQSGNLIDEWTVDRP